MERLCKRAEVKPFGFHNIRHLTASILYKKRYPLAIIQAILKHANPNRTARYIRSLGLEETREALEEGLKGPAQVIEFNKANVGWKYPQRLRLSEGLLYPDLCPAGIGRGYHCNPSIYLVVPRGVEPLLPAWEASVLTTRRWDQWFGEPESKAWQRHP